MSLAIAKGLVLPEGSRFSIGAVPAAIAGVAPTLDYRPALERREIEAVSLSDKLTFFGGNQGTFVGSDGYIQRAQTNVPRFTHDPVTRRSLGMLLEASGENLLRRSEEFNQSSWIAQNGYSVTANQAIAPDGTLTADAASRANTGAQFLFQNVTSSGTLTFSCWLRAASGTATFRLNSFNPTDGTKDSGDLTATTTWQRFSLTVTQAAASTSWYPCNGQINTTFYLWGAQLNPGALTSYIPTTTTTVTRPADSAVLDGTGIITGTYTMVEKPEGCAVINGTDIELQNGFTIERVMVFPATLTAGQITAIRAAM